MNFTVIAPIDNKVRILDQTKLPTEVVYNDYDDYRDIITSIKKLEIRGAPAIGIAGAYALAVASMAEIEGDLNLIRKALPDVAREIKKARLLMSH